MHYSVTSVTVNGHAKLYFFPSVIYLSIIQYVNRENVLLFTINFGHMTNKSLLNTIYTIKH